MTRAAYSRKYRLDNLERIRARDRKWRETRLPKVMLNAARQRARIRGLDFNLTEADIVLPATCPILGIPMKVGKGMQSFDSFSLDRIDSRLGYIVGNIQVISQLANMMKNNATPQQLLRFADWAICEFGQYRDQMRVLSFQEIHDLMALPMQTLQ